MSEPAADKILEQSENESSISDKIKESKEVVLKPTRRFFARVLDLVVVTAAVIPLVYFCHFTELSVKNYIIVQVIFAAVFLVYDFLMTFFAGATVGKMLAGLGVTDENLGKISFAGALKRSCLLLVAGLGLLIPPVTIVMTILSFIKSRQKKTLIWEKGNRTYAHYITALRCMWSSLLVVAIAALFISPVAIDMLRLVPYTGQITGEQFNADYDAIEKKYLKSVDDAGREYDPAFYKENKLYNMDGFSYITDSEGTVKGFTYSTITIYNEKFTSEERDLVIIGLAALISSDKDNRATYNVSLESFTRLFEMPFEDHDITSGGVRVIHKAVPQNDGYLITYNVSFAEYSAEVDTDESM